MPISLRLHLRKPTIRTLSHVHALRTTQCAADYGLQRAVEVGGIFGSEDVDWAKEGRVGCYEANVLF